MLPHRLAARVDPCQDPGRTPWQQTHTHAARLRGSEKLKQIDADPGSACAKTDALFWHWPGMATLCLLRTGACGGASRGRDAAEVCQSHVRRQCPSRDRNVLTVELGLSAGSKLVRRSGPRFIKGPPRYGAVMMGGIEERPGGAKYQLPPGRGAATHSGGATSIWTASKPLAVGCRARSGLCPARAEESEDQAGNVPVISTATRTPALRHTRARTEFSPPRHSTPAQ